ncbi:hypothetical protein ALON55S_03856 [Alishewanella longhuensis]
MKRPIKLKPSNCVWHLRKKNTPSLSSITPVTYVNTRQCRGKNGHNMCKWPVPIKTTRSPTPANFMFILPWVGGFNQPPPGKIRIFSAFLKNPPGTFQLKKTGQSKLDASGAAVKKPLSLQPTAPHKIFLTLEPAKNNFNIFR